MTFDEWETHFISALFAMLGFGGLTEIRMTSAGGYSFGDINVRVSPAVDDPETVVIRCVEMPPADTAAAVGAIVETARLDRDPLDLADIVSARLRGFSK
jgi:hypothetical protein